jgi:non-ribosomal peptide synthetase component E (peptide arylation enzyme)
MDWHGITIGQALRRPARTWPDTDFVVGMGARVSYADFDAQVNP